MKKKGFTFVELSIVLTIVGILVAGTLVGEELIMQARIHRVIGQMKDYDRAVVTFQQKYGAEILPGDFNRAHEFGLDRGSDGVVNVTKTADAENDGDGDEVIEDFFMNQGTGMISLFYNAEIANFWTHLSNEDLIEPFSQDTSCNYANVNCHAVAGENFPDAPLGNGIVLFNVYQSAVSNPPVLYAGEGSYYILGIGSGDLTDYSMDNSSPYDRVNKLFAHTLQQEVAFAIDEKLDDGDPRNGSVVAVMDNNLLIEASSPTGCLSTDVDGNNNYNLAIEEPQCTLAVRTAF